MFRGINALTIDGKGRFAMPKRYRACILDEMSGNLILTIDTETQCLLLYPLGEWEKIEEKLEALPSFDRSARRIQRLLIGHATDVEMDGQGRILVPPVLRDYARLEKQIMLVGQGKKFELWGESQWQLSRDVWLEEESVSKEDLSDALQSISL